MKRLLLLLVISILFFCSTIAAQRSIAGKVVEVTDGRTIVLETNAGRITAQLQYIEVPDPLQLLHKTVTDHLAKLAVGQTGEFRAVRMLEGRTVGGFTVSGVDLSLQMIRDGAAWHEPLSISGQDATQAEEYARNQELAKSEKRGVWSVVGLKAPWELRAERQVELDRQADIRRSSGRMVSAGINNFQTVVRPSVKKAENLDFSGGDASMWSLPFAPPNGSTEGYGVHTYADPNGRFTVLYTSEAYVDLESAGKKKNRVECRLIHAVNLATRETVYVIGFRSFSGGYSFRGHGNLFTISAGKRNLTVGRPLAGATSSSLYADHEVFYYRVSRAALTAIASGKDVRLRIDSLSGKVPAELSALAKDLAAATN